MERKLTPQEKTELSLYRKGDHPAGKSVKRHFAKDKIKKMAKKVTGRSCSEGGTCAMTKQGGKVGTVCRKCLRS